MRTTTRPGLSSCNTPTSRPHPSRVPGGRASTNTCASAISRRAPSTPFSFVRSSVTPCFPALRYSNIPERLGSGTSPGNGPQPRRGSPDGGSILMTSAPRSTSSFVQYGPAMSPAISTTCKPANAPVMPGYRWLSVPCTGAGREARRPASTYRQVEAGRPYRSSPSSVDQTHGVHLSDPVVNRRRPTKLEINRSPSIDSHNQGRVDTVRIEQI